MSPIDPFLHRTRVAYFSMEMAIRPEMHTYSGGLGVLAGDTARSCADLALPVVFITLASRKGYLRQEIDADGWQVDHADPWELEDWTTPLDAAVRIEQRPVWVRPWLHMLTRPVGQPVPVLLLDTRLENNEPSDRCVPTGPVLALSSDDPGHGRGHGHGPSNAGAGRLARSDGARPMNAEQLLQHAAGVVTRRRREYGEPVDVFEAIAKRWSLVFGTTVTAPERKPEAPRFNHRCGRLRRGSARGRAMTGTAGFRSPLARAQARTAPSDDDLLAMRRAAWRQQGVIMIRPEEVGDDWTRQALVNEANRLYGRRQGGGL